MYSVYRVNVFEMSGAYFLEKFSRVFGNILFDPDVPIIMVKKVIFCLLRLYYTTFHIYYILLLSTP